VFAPSDQLKIGHPSLRDKALAITETPNGGDTLESSWTVEFLEDNQLTTRDYTEQITIRRDGLHLRWSDHRGSHRFRGKWQSETRTINWQRTNTDDASIHEVTYRFLDDHRCLIEQWKTSEGQRLLVMQGEARAASPSDVIEQLRFLGAGLELNRQGEVTGASLHKAFGFQGRHAACFEQLKQLRKIDLSSSGFTDLGLIRIGRLDNLEVLNLSQTHITDHGIRHLKSLKKLRSLKLVDLTGPHRYRAPEIDYRESSAMGLTDAGMVHLKHIPTLESLDIRMSHVTNAGLTQLLELDSLSHLALPVQIDDDGLAVLAEIDSLKSLDLSSSFITDVGLRHLLKIKQLESLRFDATYITTKTLQRLNELPNLVSIAVRFTDVDDETLVALKSLEYLTELHCAFTSIGDAEIANLSDMRRLKSVNLAGTDITDAGMVHLKSLKQLEELVLFTTRISDLGLACLQDLMKLRTLNLSDTRITDRGLVYLKGLQDIEELELESNFNDVYHLQYGNPELGRLGVLKKLERLSLNLSYVARRDLEKLRKALPKCEIKLSPTLAD
ncbi:MAG: hypothetical protein ABGZ17_27165, partial [Planctomycetaceae bacterium]